MDMQTRKHTDLVTGELVRVVGWKLKTPLPSSADMLPLLLTLFIDFTLYSELASEGESGLRGWAE